MRAALPATATRLESAEGVRPVAADKMRSLAFALSSSAIRTPSSDRHYRSDYHENLINLNVPAGLKLSIPYGTI